MPKNLHSWLLERIARHSKPVFRGTDLAEYPEAELSLWLNAGVLKPADAPRRVRKVCQDGTERELEVFKHGDEFFGRCTDPEEVMDVVPLEKLELSRYRLSRNALVRAIVKSNHFDPVDFDERDALPCIAEAEGYAVFLLQPVEKFQDLLPQLHMLASQLNAEGGVIISPVRVSIPIDQRKTVAALGFQILELGAAGKDPFRVDFRPDAVAETEDEAETYTMEHTGSGWAINYLGEKFSVKDNLGARYIAHLLAYPGTVFSASELKAFLLPKDLVAENNNDSTAIAKESMEVSTRDNVIRLKLRQRQLESDRERESNQLAVAEIDNELEDVDAEL